MNRDALGTKPLTSSWAAYRMRSDAATALDLADDYAAARDRFTAPKSAGASDNV